MDCEFTGFKRGLYGLQDFGIIRLLGIIKLQSFGSKEQYKHVYI